MTLTPGRVMFPLFFNKLSLLFCELNTGILDGLVRIGVELVEPEPDDVDEFRRIGTGISDV